MKLKLVGLGGAVLLLVAATPSYGAAKVTTTLVAPGGAVTFSRSAATNSFYVTNAAGAIITNTSYAYTITNGVMTVGQVLYSRPVVIPATTFDSSLAFRSVGSSSSNLVVWWQKSFWGTNGGNTNWVNIGAMNTGGGGASNAVVYGETNGLSLGNYTYARVLVSNLTLTTISNLQIRLHHTE